MNLQNLNVAELSAQEIENTDGGYTNVVPGGCVVPDIDIFKILKR